MPLLQPEPLKRAASLSRVTGEKGREFLLRADTVSRASGVRPPQGHPVESGPLPRDMVLLQHIIIVLRLLLSCFISVQCLRCHVSLSLPVICKRKRERQDRFYYNTVVKRSGHIRSYVENRFIFSTMNLYIVVGAGRCSSTLPYRLSSFCLGYGSLLDGSLR